MGGRGVHLGDNMVLPHTISIVLESAVALSI